MNAQLSPDPTRLTGFLNAPHKLFINGQWVAARSGKTFDVINPATGQVFAQAAAGGASRYRCCGEGGAAAFESGPWRSMTASGRRAKLHVETG